MRPCHIRELKSGDVFFEDASGAKVRCEALENCVETPEGYSVRASTTLGEKSLFEAKGGRALRLYREMTARKAP